MNDAPLPDPLEDFLRQPPSLRPDAGLQESLARQTALKIRRPHGNGRWLFGAAIAASVIVAITMYYRLTSRAGDPKPKEVFVERTITPPPKKESAPQLPVKPRDLEWIAFDATDEHERVRLYFQAGDLYLHPYQDYKSAVRCYAQALDGCSDQELEIQSNDNWLVMALKIDHSKEK